MTPTARSLADLPGVGPARLAALVDAGITSPKDLLAWFPRRHRRLPAPISIADLKAESFATLDVCISRLTRRRGRRRGRSHLDLEVEDASGRLSVVLYNQGYLAQSWLPGAHLRLAGQLSADGENFQPVYHRRIDIDDRPGGAEILVEYPPISGVPAATLARLVEFTRVALAPALTDPLPSSLRCDRGLPDLAETLRILHQPKIDDPVGRAEARLLYHGFLATALRVESGRDERQPDPASVRAIITTDALQQRIEAGFGFELTPDQRAAVATIRADLAGNRPMRRLLQGDVGCGKTAVAVCAALSVAAAGAQVAILLPTDPLARQFAARLTLAAAPLGLGCELLVGGGRVADRRASRSRLAAGRSQLAIGTHAIFQDSVRFRDLGLVVVDEQHRFGVLQRLRLVRKGRSPHLLAMSATPIPRTLAMVAHSDLDQTEIRQRPPGHGRIQTRHHVVARDGRYDWAALAARLARGGRAFIVFPAVETEEGSMPSVLDEGRRIAAKYFRGLSVAALHGRMDEALKHKNLEAFREGVVRALFCTTVIEVGVDVPAATEIVIVGADRFGLAQLHQLRGRVGRGGREGYCTLLTKSKKSARSERLSLLVDCHDGFAIAEHDLDLRGPGDIMGLRQHGAAIAISGADEHALLRQAFEDARALIAKGVSATELAVALGQWTRRKGRRPVTGIECLEAG